MRNVNCDCRTFEDEVISLLFIQGLVPVHYKSGLPLYSWKHREDNVVDNCLHLLVEEWYSWIIDMNPLAFSSWQRLHVYWTYCMGCPGTSPVLQILAFHDFFHTGMCF